MAWLLNRPIRQKVALLIGVASVIALLLAGGAVVLYEVTTFRPRADRDARTQADLIRANSIAALQFKDREAAAENLATLRTRPEILSASLFGSDGALVARYAAPGAPPAPTELRAGVRFLPDRLVLIDRMEVDGQLVGWLTLQYDIPPLWRRLPQYGIMAAVVLLALGTASVLLLGMLGRSVSAPLLALAGTARTISETGEYRLRVPTGQGAEIGALTDAFNRMVATVAEQQGALRQGEARLRLALEAAKMETWIVDLPRGRDPSFAGLLDRVHPDDRDAVAERMRSALASHAGFAVEFRAAGAEAEERWTALRGQVFRDEASDAVRLIGVAQDVTEQRRIEQQLIQSQRMEAIGNLAGGVAHDFNNLLTGIIGYLGFVKRRLPPDAEVHQDLAEVERAARRAAALTSQLLSYARRQMVVPTSVDLNATVAALTPMVRRLVGEDIEVTVELAEPLAPTRVDPGQLEQVVLNLVANARDSMPSGGALRLRTRETALTEEAARLHPEARPGSYVALDVEDTGVGMTPEVQAHIFEPFFTTKPPGAGTGLGLAMCYGIVKQSDGHIMVESEPGQGSRFTVLLPQDGARAHAPGAAAAPELPSGRETILLVEDDETVRGVTLRMLQELGYFVVSAGSAAEGRARARETSERIDLLLTDVVMPGGSGRELAEDLTAAHAGLAVLFMSGYTPDVVLRQGVVQENVAFLAKPFTAPALAEALRHTLASRSERGRLSEAKGT
jgi:signal transduction histidine kinase/ActR/RegA family two-component response regulator/HAMP domain-containing protein